MNTKRTGSIVAMAGALILAAACDHSEVVAPDGSTITLAATPATILLSKGSQAEKVTILATVRDSIGVPLPNQDVRFTTNSGFLTPQAGTPVPTDDIGNAVTVLDGAKATTAITAQSGKATANISLQTVTCNIQSIALSESQLNFTTCNPADAGGSFDLTATVTDTSNNPCQGIQIKFESTVPNPPDTDVGLSISPGSVTTDTNGEAKTTVTLAGDCVGKCTGKDCNTSGQQIKASGGGITGSLVSINISIQ
jgi:hypothetical protein